MQAPSTFFERGNYYLRAGQPYESLRAYAKALQIDHEKQHIEIALKSFNEITNHDQTAGYEWIRRFLQVGIAVKFPGAELGEVALEQLKNIKSKNCQPFKEPVVIVAGGCSVEVRQQICTYQELLLESFLGFRGTIVSGGTTSGVSGLIGEVQQKYPNSLRTVGYFPKTRLDLLDPRFCEIRFTENENFSPMEPLQYWIDIISSGIKADGVKLLGINGGKISAIEYRIATAFGAQVAIIKGSGKEADKLLLDKEWATSKNLISMTADSKRLQEFIQIKSVLS